LALVLALAFFAVVAVPAVVLGRLYGHMAALSASARTGAVDLAVHELDSLTPFYQVSRDWHLGWLADRLFADAFLQRAAAAYLSSDYERVITDLRERVDDPRAAHLLGCARFRLAQRRYRAIEAKDPQAAAKKAAVVQEVLEQVNSDFEHAVRADRTNGFAARWNYDLTSNADAIRRALEVPAAAAPPELERRRGSRSPVRPRRG
jgi:hypothetical protein